MVKKEFTEPRSGSYNEMSDVELIEELDKGIYSPAEINVINAILGKRTKKSIQDLKEVVQKNSVISEKYNNILIDLTKWVLLLTVIMTIATGVNILVTYKYGKLQSLPVVEQLAKNKKRAMEYCNSNINGEVQDIEGNPIKCSDLLKK